MDRAEQTLHPLGVIIIGCFIALVGLIIYLFARKISETGAEIMAMVIVIILSFIVWRLKNGSRYYC